MIEKEKWSIERNRMRERETEGGEKKRLTIFDHNFRIPTGSQGLQRFDG